MFGLAYLAFALAVAIRFGVIPFHIVVARLTDAVPETGLPVLIALGPASLAIVGIAWVDSSIAPLPVDVGSERAIVVAIAAASIILATFAAWIQDDLEHVVGYSIVGDAGVVMLALAALDPAAWTPGRIWILAFVVSRSAFAAWAAVVRDSFGTSRLPDLRGWAIRSPLLAVGLVTIVVASIGLPAFAAFEARSELVDLALDGPLQVVVLIATIAPILYYVRVLGIGLRRLDVQSAPAVDWRPHWTSPDLTDVRGSIARLSAANRVIGVTALSLVLALAALLTSIGAFGGPEAAAGLPPVDTIPGEVALTRSRYSAGGSTHRSTERSYSSSSSGANHRPSSTSAASGPSDAWTMFCAVSRAKSPRIVPGAASCGRVAPLMARTTTIAFGPSRASATSGDDVMKSTRLPKNGRSACAA